MIQKIKSYFVRKRANKLRNDMVVKSLHAYEKSFYDTCAFIDVIINTPIKEIAYTLSEKDENRQSPEYYWFKAEETVEYAKEYKKFITDTFNTLTASTYYSLRKHK